MRLGSRPLDLLDAFAAYDITKYSAIALSVGGNCLENFKDRLKMTTEEVVADLDVIVSEVKLIFFVFVALMFQKDYIQSLLTVEKTVSDLCHRITTTRKARNFNPCRH